MSNIDSKKVCDVLTALKFARDFQKAKAVYGSKRVDLYVKDVEGYWLDEWK